MTDVYPIGSHRFRSRLIVGSGKYASFPLQLEATHASGADLITVALRRVDLGKPKSENVLGYLPEGMTILPNTAGCWDQHGLQCGFCTPGMMMQATWLLEQNPDPTEQQIREGISGNLCRCTGYVNIVKAIQQAAGELAAEPVEQASASCAGRST